MGGLRGVPRRLKGGVQPPLGGAVRLRGLVQVPQGAAQIPQSLQSRLDGAGHQISDSHANRGEPFAHFADAAGGVLHGVPQRLRAGGGVLEPLLVGFQLGGQLSDFPLKFFGLIGPLAVFQHGVGIAPPQLRELFLLLSDLPGEAFGGVRRAGLLPGQPGGGALVGGESALEAAQARGGVFHLGLQLVEGAVLPVIGVLSLQRLLRGLAVLRRRLLQSLAQPLQDLLLGIVLLIQQSDLLLGG